jgi:hypothetical protein
MSLQIATFKLPEQTKEANQFLATHKPQTPFNVENGVLTIMYEDGKTSKALALASLNELLAGNKEASLQLDISIAVLSHQMMELNPNKVQMMENATTEIARMREAREIQDVKKAYVESLIADLENSDGEEAGK